MIIKKTLPEFYENWVACNSGMPLLGKYEYSLYSDSRFLQSISNSGSPYNFFSTMPSHAEPGYVQVPLVLRLDYYLPQMISDQSMTDDSHYHGGTIVDEIAALTSLCLGTRIRAGGISRTFSNQNKDLLGIPVDWDHRLKPVLNLNKDRLVLPHIARPCDLSELYRLGWLLYLSAEQVIALIRAARLYQDALWIAESEPALAWLMFVSSLEVAANQWKSGNGTPADRLKDSKIALVKILMDAGGEDLVNKVAQMIEPTLGATKKFLEFTLEFFPKSPCTRPREEYQICWKDKKEMRKILSLVYGYRSTALHGGTPFPAPMCAPPFSKIDNEYAEKGTIRFAEVSSGGVWQAKDIPINLHIFHHIVRGTLLTWWEKMANDSKEVSNEITGDSCH